MRVKSHQALRGSWHMNTLSSACDRLMNLQQHAINQDAMHGAVVFCNGNNIHH